MDFLYFVGHEEAKHFKPSDKHGFVFTDEKHGKDFKKVDKKILKISIDCPNCSKKVERGLNEFDDIYKATLDFNNQILIVESVIGEEEIKQRAISISDEITFPNEMRTFFFDVSIDCPNCARKVENYLNAASEINKALLDFNNGKLIVETNLSEEAIIKLAKEADDDIEFIAGKEETNKEEKDYTLVRATISILLLSIALIFKLPLIAIISYLISGYDVIYRAIKNILKGHIFDENFLMTIATIGALIIASYEEASGVMVFYQVGEYFQRKAVGKSRKSISELLDLTPDYASVIVDGKEVLKKAEDIIPGDILVVKPGERIALDGIVVEGSSLIDTKALTGESVPRKVVFGEEVLSGYINGEGLLKIKATTIYSDSTASKIIRLAKESEGKKAKSEMFITRFSRYYTPIIVAAALLIALLPPLFGLSELSDSIYKACMLLVISCPCALVLSVPLTYYASIGSFAKNGILVKGAGTIEALSHIDTLALDKTGTLTEGSFEVRSFEMLSNEIAEDKAKSIASALEASSNHPIARAISSYLGKSNLNAQSVVEKPGIGIFGTVENCEYSIGNNKLITNISESNHDGTVVYLVKDGRALARFLISDNIKNSSYLAIDSLRRIGIKNIVMLSGDRKSVAETVSKELKLDRTYSELLPQDKLKILETLIEKGTTAYAGDGINDAPALKRADVGIAMGGVGSDAAIEAADAVILDDSLIRISDAISISKKTEKIVKENIGFSLSVKAIVFAFAIVGLSNMWLAVLADTGVALIAVINAMRAHKLNKRR